METTEQLQAHLDSWANLFTGLGIVGRDKLLATRFTADVARYRDELDQLYRSNGFARRIVDLPANEMTREWFEVTGDEDGNVSARLEEIDAKNQIRDLIRWGRLYGGAIAVMGIDDGQDLNLPVAENSIRSVEFLHVFDRHEVQWTWSDLYADPRNPKFGKVEFYQVTPIYGVERNRASARPGTHDVTLLTSTGFRVHETRVLRYDGEPVPARIRAMNNGWGDSVLQCCFEQLRNLGTAYAGTAHIIEDFSQGKLSIKDLASMIAAGQEAVIIKRLQIADMARHILNTMLLDTEETYAKESTSVTGLPDLLDRQAGALSAVTGMPQTLLMGRSPAGMNATGESDVRQWYDAIAAEQEDRLQPLLEPLVRYVQLAKDGEFHGVELEDWKIEFNPLWQVDPKDEATVYKTNAEADAQYVAMGALEPEEIAIARFGGEGTAGIVVDVKEREDMLEERRKAQEEAAKQALENPPPAPPTNGGAPPNGGGDPATQGAPVV